MLLKTIRQRILQIRELLHMKRKRQILLLIEKRTKTMNKQFTENLNYY